MKGLDEDRLVRITTAGYLANALAWQLVHPYDEETFDPEARPR